MNMCLSDALRALCSKANLSQLAMSQKAGFKSVTGVSAPIARGDMQVSTLLRIADVAGYQLVLARKVNITQEEPIVIDSAGKYKKEE